MKVHFVSFSGFEHVVESDPAEFGLNSIDAQLYKNNNSGSLDSFGGGHTGISSADASSSGPAEACTSSACVSAGGL